MENKKWIFLCILGGSLMIIGSVVGNPTIFMFIYGVAAEHVGPKTQSVLTVILNIFTYIAFGGGISVIGGSTLVMMHRYKIGKLTIWIGAGMGMIGLLIFLILQGIEGTLISMLRLEITTLMSLNGGFGFAGVILVVFSRFKMKKSKQSKKTKYEPQTY
ncbi:MAG: hypothetical protein ACFFDK_05235 [Promethearchaeota archaeon]